MPRNTDYDDFDDDDDEDDNRDLDGEKLVKHLRRQLKERDKRLADIDKQLAEYAKRDRQETVGSVLKAAQVNEKYARWVVRDLEDQDITAEGVQKWLEENAELVGLQPRETSTVDDETQNSLRRIQNADAGAKGADVDPIAAKLSDPNLTPAELEQLIGKSLNA